MAGGQQNSSFLFQVIRTRPSFWSRIWKTDRGSQFKVWITTFADLWVLWGHSQDVYRSWRLSKATFHPAQKGPHVNFQSLHRWNISNSLQYRHGTILKKQNKKQRNYESAVINSKKKNPLTSWARNTGYRGCRIKGYFIFVAFRLSISSMYSLTHPVKLDMTTLNTSQYMGLRWCTQTENFSVKTPSVHCLTAFLFGHITYFTIQRINIPFMKPHTHTLQPDQLVGLVWLEMLT